MRYSTEPRYKKYVKGFGFLSFARKFGDKYGKRLMDTATKTGIDAAKTASKRVVHKTAEATADLIGNKIADKITSLSKTKSKEKEHERQETYIPPEKRQQIIDDLRLLWYHIKMEYQNITNLLGATPNEVTRFITKKWIEVHDQSGNAEDRYKPSKQIKFKTSILRSDLCNFSDAYIAVKWTITVARTDNKSRKNRPLAFKNNAPFISCISKINNTLIDNAGNLVVAMPMYNLIKHSKNYRKTTGSLWNYYRDELSDDTSTNNNPNINVINSESFKYKTSITGSTYNEIDNPAYDAKKLGKKVVQIAISLKYWVIFGEL